MLPPLVMRRLVSDVAADGKYGLLPLLIGALFSITLLRAGMTYSGAPALPAAIQAYGPFARDRQLSDSGHLSTPRRGASSDGRTR